MKRTIAIGICITLVIGYTLWQGPLKAGIFKFAKKHAPGSPALQDGDIIFQSNSSDFCKAIKLATHSKYSHCGMIFKEGNDYYVYEAVQPVKKTPLASWTGRGDGGHYEIKRLSNTHLLTDSVIKNMKTVFGQMQGKDYDGVFAWDDNEIYCSELVWKLYKRAAGIEVGQLKQLKDFDLADPLVQHQLYVQHGEHIPYDDTVIAPQSIYESNMLVTVEKE